ncbi:MAG: TonB-dependent receptor, partial [Mucilaginibacter sp.]
NNVAAKFKAGKWELQGNVLNTYIHDEEELGIAAKSRSVFTPTLMASFAPLGDKNLHVRAFYKEIFRNPNFTEQYYYATRPRDIKPEYVKQYDLGATYARHFSDVLQYFSITADAYYNDVDNKILYLPGRSAEIPSVINLGKVDIRGLDVNMKSLLKFSNKFTGSISAGYTFQKSVDVTDVKDEFYGEQIPYTPEHTLTVNAGVTYNSISVYYNHILSSLRYYTSNNKPDYLVPGYNISDASVQYRFKAYKMPVSLSAEVNNLFNQNYEVVRSYPMPPRSYRLTFQITK